MNTHAPRLLIAFLLAILLLGCTEGGGSIYYTLETETKVVDNTLPNAMTVFDVTKVDSASAYYAAAGKMWAGAIAGSSVTWDTNNPVAPPEAGDLCTALVASPFGAAHTDTLYGGFIYQSGNRGLYESTAAPAPSFSGRSPLGTSGDILGAQIALLKVENAQLVAVAAKKSGVAFEYFIYTSGNGSTFSELSFDGTRAAGEEEKPVNDVIYSSTLGTWFATEGTKLYSGAGPLTLADMTGITSGEKLNGLFDDGSKLYLASASGAIYYSSDGTSWTRIAAPTVSGAHPPLTTWAGRWATPIGTGILLVGSDGYGYYRLDTTDLGGTAPLTRFPTTTIDLHSALVMKFFYDSVESRVFACTSLEGLWRGAVAVDGTITWGLE